MSALFGSILVTLEVMLLRKMEAAMKCRSRRRVSVGAMLFGAAALAFVPTSMVCAQTASAPAGSKPFLTLDGKQPLVIGHRGVPGLMPEETEASYELAAALGTDSLEEEPRSMRRLRAWV